MPKVKVTVKSPKKPVEEKCFADLSVGEVFTISGTPYLKVAYPGCAASAVTFAGRMVELSAGQIVRVVKSAEVIIEKL